jgi:4-hydroxybenzoate polyprenyltransferase
MRFHKPIGIFLLLWPTLWALWLAGEGKPNLFIVLIFMLGVVLMRAAGCVINDLADRHFDAHVERTRDRPLVTGQVSTKEALVLFFILIFCAFLLVLFLNQLTFQLAFIGALLAVIYPLLKRVTHLPQFGLGLAFAWGVPMSFAALTNSVPLKAWVLFFAAAIWPVIYDTMYAMVDREDDKKIGVKSTAILFANYDRMILGVLQVMFLVSLFLVGYLFGLDQFYDMSLLAVLGLFLYQQKLIKNRERENCFKAFLNNHWVGLFIFAGMVASYGL